MKHTIVGQTLPSGEIIPHQPIVTVAKPGDIVYVFSQEHDIAPQWYRVYDDGSLGLRFWCVTMAYAQAVEDAAMWAEMAELDDYAATLGVDRPLFLEERKHTPIKDDRSIDELWLDEQEIILDEEWDWRGGLVEQERDGEAHGYW